MNSGMTFCVERRFGLRKCHDADEAGGVGVAEYVPVGPDHVPPPRPRLGRLVGLVEQPGIGDPDFSWSSRSEAPEYVDVSYQVSGGNQHGRNLQGSLRTFLLPPDTEWETMEGLGALHLAELSVSEPGRPDYPDSPEPPPVWQQIIVTVDGARLVARQTIYRGFEGIVFRLGGRIASSAFSVFDASRIDEQYRTLRLPWSEG